MLDLFKKPTDKDYSAFLLFPAVILALVVFTQKGLWSAVDTVSGVLCVMSIGALASMSSANAGCKFGIVGVVSALLVAFKQFSEVPGTKGSTLGICVFLLFVGSCFGLWVGLKVSPIKLPQTVAAFHSLVGLAAMCTSIGSYANRSEPGYTLENFGAVFGDFIGGITFTGSIIAFGKLNGNLKSTPLNLPGKNCLNLAALLLFAFLAFLCLDPRSHIMHYHGLNFHIEVLWIIAALAMLLGFHLVGSVGGGDMPVCITVLNSYSGWALVAEGFLLHSPVLTIVGSLIGFSGGILTKIMCDAMNRDIFNVIFGGLNNAPVVKGADAGPKEHKETSVADVAAMLANAN